VKKILRSPLVWILVVAGALRLAGLFWGMPASDGWDDDGFAPRNFLTALALTYKPASYFTYPPLHAILLALLTWPGIVWALLQAHSHSQADIVRAFTAVPTATVFAVVARLVSAVMSLGIIVCVGQMAALVAGRRAGLLASAACALNVAFTYYSQVSNLDVPCLFWCSLSLLTVMQAIAWQAPQRFWRAGLFAAAAITTKDQGYAVFAAAMPALLLVWFAADRWPRHNARAVWVPLLEAIAAALLFILLLDGALTNLAGFVRRIEFLTGPASQDYAAYSRDMAGRLRLLADMAATYTSGIGFLACLLAGSGMALHITRMRDKALWVAGLVPLFAMISFTLCFNFAALRSDARFLLPQAIFATPYIGIALARLFAMPQPWLRAMLAMAGLYALFQCAAVEAVLWDDPRYDAQSWMRAHIAPGATIETYGQNAYLPHFAQNAVISRIGETPLSRRNPLPNVTERQAAFSTDRNAQYIVVSDWWMQNYLVAPENGDGRVIPKVEQARLDDSDARQYFIALEGGQLPYRLVHESRYSSKFWPMLHIHESTGESIQIFERIP
jgi:hypothetical protein